MILYDYYRSSAAYRVRICLNLKGKQATVEPVNLLQNEQLSASYSALNPNRLVPTLVTDAGDVLTQSLAICEYLDEVYPDPPLLPQDALGRSRCRALAGIVAADIHPIANLRVQRYLQEKLGADNAAKRAWIQHWISAGFEAYEAQLDPTATYSCGEQVTLADLCLVPQYYNALRFETDLQPFPKLQAVAERCRAIPEFQAAAPESVAG